MGREWGEENETDFLQGKKGDLMAKWKSTKYAGVRYYEHPTRKHGVAKKDKYYAIRYQNQGKRIEEGLGWTSGGWTEEKAALKLAELKKAARTGEGPTRLAEKRAIKKDRQQAEVKEKAQLELEAITFKEVFDGDYSIIGKNNKCWQAWQSEQGLIKNWIGPVIGSLPLKTISPIHLERIKKNMSGAGRAASSIRYALAVIRQVFNFARSIGIFSGENPVCKIKIPSADNRRLRFLTHTEADALLNALSMKSRDVHDMALLSLHCGLRAGEVFSLTWGDVDISEGILTLRDTKSGKSRYSFMTAAVKMMLESRPRERHNDLVFSTRTGAQKVQSSKTFNLTVDEFKLNEGVTDRRQKVVWHSLRHTFASWLVSSGVDLYTVKTLMGHSGIAMTERYSHLGQGTLQNAVKVFEKGITITGQKEAEQVVNFSK